MAARPRRPPGIGCGCRQRRGTSLPLASVWAAETLASGGPGPCGERAVGARRAQGRWLRAAVRRGQRSSSGGKGRVAATWRQNPSVGSGRNGGRPRAGSGLTEPNRAAGRGETRHPARPVGLTSGLGVETQPGAGGYVQPC